MRLSDHLSKAAWSMADRGVFLAYGLVGIKQLEALPVLQFGVFVFFDTVYNILFTLSDGFVLQALVKFGVDETREREVMTLTFVVHVLFIGTLAMLALLMRTWLASVLNEPRYVDVLVALPVLALLTVPRTYALKLFQMLIRTRDIFLVNLAFFGTMTVMTFVRIAHGTLQTAEDMIAINISGAIAGSVAGIVLAIPHARFRIGWSRALVREMTPFSFFQGSAVLSNVIQQFLGEFTVKFFGTTSDLALYGAAKRFYKVFEAARDAVGTIAYPAAARLHTQQRIGELKLLIEKMMSFALIGMIPVVAACWLGGSAFMFHLFFHAKFDASIPVFNVLALVGLAIPFTLNITVLTGLGQSRTLLKVIVISSLVSLLGNILFVQWFHAIGAALAVVIAAVVTGVLATRAVQAEVPISMATLFRGVGDALSFLSRRSHEKS